MALLTESEVIARSRTVSRATNVYKATASTKTYDVFLSHSSNEPDDIIFGIKGLLEDANLTVYIDKVDDPQLSPDHVTPETAEILRMRMKSSSSLLYVHSRHSTKSRWMPWELGYFDALKGSVGILPVTSYPQSEFKGEEYLGLYPYADINYIANSSTKQLWINKSQNEYAALHNWSKGLEKIRKR